MPFKKVRVYKQRKGKRVYMKRVMRQAKINVNRALQPIPQRYICKMKYSDIITTQSVDGTYTFNLNSTWDPNRTGVGHQPYGRDTLATLYNRYRVISCGYRILGWASGANAGFQMAVQPANEVLSPGSIDEMRENPRSKYAICVNGAAPAIIKGKVSIPSLVGRSKSQYMADDRYQAQVDTSPSELAILNIMTRTYAGDITFQPLQVLLEYTVEWFDVKHLAQS